MMLLRKFQEFYAQKETGAALFIREGSRVYLEGDQGFSCNKVDIFVASDKVVL
jgi:hypothetical protein